MDWKNHGQRAWKVFRERRLGHTHTWSFLFDGPGTHTHTHNDLWDIQNDLRSSGVHQRGKWTFLFRHCIAKPIMQNGAKSRIEFFCFISAMMFSKTPPDQQLHKTGTWVYGCTHKYAGIKSVKFEAQTAWNKGSTLRLVGATKHRKKDQTNNFQGSGSWNFAQQTPNLRSHHNRITTSAPLAAPKTNKNAAGSGVATDLPSLVELENIARIDAEIAKFHAPRMSSRLESLGSTVRVQHFLTQKTAKQQSENDVHFSQLEDARCRIF